VSVECLSTPVGGFESELSTSVNAFVAGSQRKNVYDYDLDRLNISAFGYSNTNRFCSDGSRRYLDGGGANPTPEFCGPEAINYTDAAHAVPYGYLVTAKEYLKAAQEAQEKGIVLDIDIQMYANGGGFNGLSQGSSHMSLLTLKALPLESYKDVLAGHHATRIVWSGAGKVVESSDRSGSFDFHLSERARHIREVTGYQSTIARPLVHLRLNSAYAHNDLYDRNHDISGEPVISPRANALRLASEAILLKACGLNEHFEGILPIYPVVAMQYISEDMNLQARVPVGNGRYFTGIETQLALAEQAMKTVGHYGLLTEQDEFLGNKWIALCEKLKDDPISPETARQIDWVKKLSFIEAKLQENQSGRSDFEVARDEDRRFAQLLPELGPGMLALIADEYDDGPTTDILANGPPLPETRARPRGKAIGRLALAGIKYRADWDKLQITDPRSQYYKLPTALMPDPFDTDPASLQNLMQLVGV
jgi:hypothetical protein